MAPLIDTLGVGSRASGQASTTLTRRSGTRASQAPLTLFPDPSERSSGSRQDTLADIARQQDRLPSGAGYSFAIADVDSDAPVGQIGLWLADMRHGRANTGYWIAAPHRRRGLMADALQTLSDWALTMDEVKRLELYVEPWNEGSWRSAEKCGFRREGLLRSWQEVGGQRKDMYMYSRLPLA